MSPYSWGYQIVVVKVELVTGRGKGHFVKVWVRTVTKVSFSAFQVSGFVEFRVLSDCDFE